MYTFIMRANAAPGKLTELVGLWKTWNELSMRRFSWEGFKVMTTVGGSFSEVTCIWQAESLDEWQERSQMLFTDPEISALAPKVGACILPNSLTTSILKPQN